MCQDAKAATSLPVSQKEENNLFAGPSGEAVLGNGSPLDFLVPGELPSHR